MIFCNQSSKNKIKKKSSEQKCCRSCLLIYIYKYHSNYFSDVLLPTHLLFPFFTLTLQPRASQNFSEPLAFEHFGFFDGVHTDFLYLPWHATHVGLSFIPPHHSSYFAIDFSKSGMQKSN